MDPAAPSAASLAGAWRWFAVLSGPEAAPALGGRAPRRWPVRSAHSMFMLLGLRGIAAGSARRAPVLARQDQWICTSLPGGHLVKRFSAGAATARLPRRGRDPVDPAPSSSPGGGQATTTDSGGAPPAAEGISVRGRASRQQTSRCTARTPSRTRRPIARAGFFARTRSGTEDHLTRCAISAERRQAYGSGSTGAARAFPRRCFELAKTACHGRGSR